MSAIFFDSKEIGDLVSRMNDAEIIEETTTEIASQTLIEILVTVIITIYLFYVDLFLGLLVLGSIISLIGIAYLYNSKIIFLQRKYVLAHSSRESSFIDIFNNIEMIKSYSQENKFSTIISGKYQSYQKTKLNLSYEINKFNTLINIFQLFISVSSFIYMALGVLNHNFELGSLFATYILVNRFNSSIREVIVLNVNIQGALVSLQRLKDFSQIEKFENKNFKPVYIDNIIQPLVLQAKALSIKFSGHIELINESDFTASSNAITCIYGRNGTGKSTFLKVLKRIYAPTNGKIMINGYNHDTISISNWNDIVTYIEQSPQIIKGTIYENICIGNDISQSELNDFLLEYNFMDFINSFPNGILTQIGSGGIPISGGQKELISIIRGVISKAPVLLFDEPTSSIDASYKAIIINLLRKIKKSRIIIISTHDNDLLEISKLIYKIIDKKLVLQN